MSRFDRVLLSHMRNILDGKEQFIPNPYGRLSEVFNTHKGRYILVGSNTGLGKTSFVDDYLLRTFELSKKIPEAHFEVLYYSMERNEREKQAKWLSWKMYNQEKCKIASNVFSIGEDKGIKLNQSLYDKANGYSMQMDTLFEHVKIFNGVQKVERISQDIEEAAKRLGIYIHSDDLQVYKNGIPIPNAAFSDKYMRGSYRGKVPYLKLSFNGVSFEIGQNEDVYLPKKPNTFLFIVIDHIGKTALGKKMIKKAAIDELDEVLARARDNYYFNPIVISQFNRDIADPQRLKLSGGNLEPILEDFKESGNTQESADLILSIFDPYRYRAYDNDGMYKGYRINSVTHPCTLTPSGVQRFRSLHILKNSYGVANVTYGMKFLGEVMTFQLMPPPDHSDMNTVYAEIATNN